MVFMDLGEGLKKVFLAGVGAVATTAETAKEVIDDLVSKGELTSVMQAVGSLEKLLDDRCRDQNTLALVKALVPYQQFDKLLENQQLLIDPIVRNGRQATAGYCPDIWKEWK